MIKSNNQMIDLIMGNSETFALLNAYLDTLQGVNPYYMSYDIEYVARLVVLDESGKQKFLRKHRTDARYRQMYSLACAIREVLDGKEGVR